MSFKVKRSITKLLLLRLAGLKTFLCRKWGERACRLLEAFCAKDQFEGLRHKGCDLAETLVKCVSREWADKSPLELAVLHKNEAFVGSLVVQRLHSKAWMGSLATHVTAWKVS